MSEIKDPAIKLFGTTIPLSESQIPADSVESSDPGCQIQADSEDLVVCMETSEANADDPPAEVPEKSNTSSTLNDSKEDNQQTPTEENIAVVDVKPEEDKVKSNTASQEKVLKKPDKILPCPRCNSLDTKFCYYNNYNVNQPRHFCKNCQRYWTAGGTMRNVPVGAGRRKNKHSASQYRHIMMSSDGISSTQVDNPDSANNQIHSHGGFSTPPGPMNGTRKVLKFGPDTPLCESMAAVLNLGEKRNLEMGSVANGHENGEEPTSSSSVTVSNCRENGLPQNIGPVEQGSLPSSCNGFAPHPLPCFHGPPWPYPWNSSWNIAAIAAGPCPSSDQVHGPENDASNTVQWSGPSMAAARAICPPSVPIPIVHPSYWGCMPTWTGGAWSVPWLASNGNLSPSSSTSTSGCSGNGSQTLGKHSRDVNLQGEEKPEKCLWVPKTLRFNDPDDAAKSSIWATLGIKPDQNEPITKGGIFKAFQPKTEGDHHLSDATQVLQANPAALSRSQTFQEAT